MFVALIPVFLAPLPARGAHSGDPLDSTSSSTSNPDLSGSCGLDILFVLDETGSMEDEEQDLVDAVQAFRGSLEGTLSRIGIIEFSSLPETGGVADPNPGVPQSARDVTGGYLSPTNATLTGYTQVDGVPASNTDSYNADGYTSWQEALWKASQYATADLLVFFTDGNPNTVDGDSHVSSGGNHGYGNAPADEAAEFAAAYANIIKNKGTHILGMGLGFNAGQAARLAMVSGPHGVSLPGGTFNVSTTDYVTFSDPDDIAAALEEISNQLCNTEINITKWVPGSPSAEFDSQTGTGSGFVKDNGWTFDITLSDNNGYSWVTGMEPPGATSSGGMVEFRYALDNRGDTSDATITESVLGGYSLLGGNCVETPSGGQVGQAIPFGSNGWTVEDISDRATVHCNVYNDGSFISLNKTVINDDGGSASKGQFELTATGRANGGSASGFGDHGPNMVPADTYDLSESGPDGYTASLWTCGNHDVNNASVVIPVGAHVICSITNNDIMPTLTLTKVVNHTNGGSAAPADWTLFAKSGPTTVLSGSSGVSGQVPGDTYDLTESGPANYSLVGWSCTNGDTDGTVTLGSGDNVTCTATNDSDPGHLKLVKSVSNAYGSQESAGSWNLAADGPDSNDFNGSGTAESDVPEGDYVLSESGPANWTGSEWSCGGGSYNSQNDTVSVGIGESVTCTITNRPVQPQLTLVKQLILGEGANETTDDFLLKAEGPVTIQGHSGNTEVTNAGVNLGTYVLSESGPSGYPQVGGWICVGGSQDDDEITLAVGESATCTVTNASDPAKLTLVKEVINDDGGLVPAGDFQLTLNGHSAPQGENTVVPNTEYTVSELAIDGYTLVGVVCKDGGQVVPHPVTLDEGQEVTCTVTNNDQPGAIKIIKQFAHNTNAVPGDFSLTLNDDPVVSGISNVVPGNATYIAARACSKAGHRSAWPVPRASKVRHRLIIRSSWPTANG